MSYRADSVVAQLSEDAEVMMNCHGLTLVVQ